MSDALSQSKCEWKEAELGEICDYIKRGFSPKYVEQDGHIIINQRCIRNGTIDFSLSKLTSKERKITPEKMLIHGDILINSTGVGTAGRVAFFNQNLTATADSHVSIVRVNAKRAKPLFVFYNLRGREEEIEGIAEGSTGQIELGSERLKLLEILLPPLPEQIAIAEVLSSLDDKIDLLHRQNQTLEQMAETLFRQWFLPGGRHGVEEADEGWEIVKLGNFISTNISSLNKDYPHENIEYLDTGSLTQGKWGELQPFSLKEAPSRAKRLVQHNDILYSTVRPNQLHYGLVRNPIENLVVSTGFCVIACDNISPYFVYYLLTENSMTEYLHSIAEGSTSTYPSLKPDDLEAVEFALPPAHSLKKFHYLSNSAWNKIEHNYNQIHTLTALRDTVLPKLMSGEVNVCE